MPRGTRLRYRTEYYVIIFITVLSSRCRNNNYCCRGIWSWGQEERIDNDNNNKRLLLGNAPPPCRRLTVWKHGERVTFPPFVRVNGLIVVISDGKSRKTYTRTEKLRVDFQNFDFVTFTVCENETRTRSRPAFVLTVSAKSIDFVTTFFRALVQ